jgi:hypothetical protein
MLKTKQTVLRLTLAKLISLVKNAIAVQRLNVKAESDFSVIKTLADLLEKGLHSKSKDVRLCAVTNYDTY